MNDIKNDIENYDRENNKMNNFKYNLGYNKENNFENKTIDNISKKSDDNNSDIIKNISKSNIKILQLKE